MGMPKVLEGVDKAEHFKGYYDNLTDLKNDFPAATAGDYAIVGSAIYVWDSSNNEWTKISGSGGGGTGGDYVPLVGDSTIDGNITVTGTLGVTSHAYMKYNETEKCIEFIFPEE